MNATKLFCTYFFLRNTLEIVNPNNFVSLLFKKIIPKGPKQVLKSRRKTNFENKLEKQFQTSPNG